MSGPSVVALGGGHGLSASLSALRLVTDRLTAVVTVADDGGSSGRLRAEFDILPPGDLRMALGALSDRGGTRGDQELGARLMEHRFPGDGPLSGHAVGNLMLAGLIEVLGDPVAALDTVGRWLDGVGRVLPLSEQPMDLAADVVGADPDRPLAVRSVHGQVAVATAGGRVASVRVVPEDPPACPAAVAAVRDADWVVLGPGSWFSSVLPHVLVPGMARALAGTRARCVVVTNLAPQPGETTGFGPENLLEVLGSVHPELTVHTVLVDPTTVGDEQSLRRTVDAFGSRLVLADVARGDGTPRHDPERLAAAFREIFGGTEGATPWRP